MKTGIQLIAAERKRQIEKEGWTPEHDAEHDDGSLALVAALYAAPVHLYERLDYALCAEFQDPWPESWDTCWDKRREYGDSDGVDVADPKTYTPAQRLDLLVKAGALIAAEIDRLQRPADADPDKAIEHVRSDEVEHHPA